MGSHLHNLALSGVLELRCVIQIFTSTGLLMAVCILERYLFSLPLSQETHTMRPYSNSSRLTWYETRLGVRIKTSQRLSLQGCWFRLTCLTLLMNVLNVMMQASSCGWGHIQLTYNLQSRNIACFVWPFFVLHHYITSSHIDRS